MSEKTTNYQLTKLDSAEIGSMIDLNSNADKLDAALKQNHDAQQRHNEDLNNPHCVTKEQIGLGNTDNTSDASKPLSIAQQNALNEKAGINHSHSAADINSGTLPVSWGGTGQSSLPGIKNTLGIAAMQKSLDNVISLLEARNKLLWTGSLTNGCMIDVPELDNYRVIHVVLNSGIHITCERDEKGRFLGGGVLTPWSGGAHVTGQICLIVQGGRYLLENTYSSFMAHGYLGDHGEKYNFEISNGSYIVKIIGIEPISEKILAAAQAM